MWKVCWNKGRLCWKIAKLFYFCHLKKLVTGNFWTVLRTITTLICSVQWTLRTKTLYEFILSSATRTPTISDEQWQIRSSSVVKFLSPAVFIFSTQGYKDCRLVTSRRAVSYEITDLCLLSTRSKLPTSLFHRLTRCRTPQLGGYFVRPTF